MNGAGGDQGSNDRGAHRGGSDRGGNNQGGNRGGNDWGAHRGGGDQGGQRADNYRSGNDRGGNGGGSDRGGQRGGSDRAGNNQGGNRGGGNGRGYKQAKKGRSKGQAPESARTSGDFWGDPARLPPVSEVAVSADGSAVIRSLGRPPVTGHEAASEYYFRVACDRAVNLAAVLATAGDLLDDEDDEDPD